MIQQAPDVMHEERIEQISDLLFIGEVEGTFEGDPECLSVGQGIAGRTKKKDMELNLTTRPSDASVQFSQHGESSRSSIYHLDDLWSFPQH